MIIYNPIQVRSFVICRTLGCVLKPLNNEMSLKGALITDVSSDKGVSIHSRMLFEHYGELSSKIAFLAVVGLDFAAFAPKTLFVVVFENSRTDISGNSFTLCFIAISGQHNLKNSRLVPTHTNDRKIPNGDQSVNSVNPTKTPPKPSNPLFLQESRRFIYLIVLFP